MKSGNTADREAPKKERSRQPLWCRRHSRGGCRVALSERCQEFRLCADRGGARRPFYERVGLISSASDSRNILQSSTGGAMTSARMRLFLFCRASADGVRMLSAYVPTGTSLEQKIVEPGQDVPEAAVWIDLVTPTRARTSWSSGWSASRIPTREEMQEIELSSRLYVENGARYMTATLMCQSDTPSPENHAGDLHPRRPSPDHRALRRAEAVRGRAPQAHPLLARKRCRARASSSICSTPWSTAAPISSSASARRSTRSRTTSSSASAPARRNSTPSCCRPSAARASSPPKCAKAWSRSDGC